MTKNSSHDTSQLELTAEDDGISSQIQTPSETSCKQSGMKFGSELNNTEVEKEKLEPEKEKPSEPFSADSGIKSRTSEPPQDQINHSEISPAASPHKLSDQGEDSLNYRSTPQKKEGACLSISDLDKLPKDTVFRKDHFPSTFFETDIDVEVLEEVLQWTTAWLRRREDREDYVQRKKMLPIEGLHIHLAFNQLSNDQLRVWRGSVQQKINGQRPSDETVMASKPHSTPLSSPCPSQDQVLQEGDLEFLPEDFHFSKANFPPLFFIRSSNITMTKYVARISWAKKWLSLRRDRKGIHVPDLNLTSVVSAFNNLSNQQLQLWTMKQEEKLNLLKSRDTIKASCEAEKATKTDPKKPTLAEVDEEDSSAVLTLSAITNLPPKFKFAREMFPAGFLFPVSKLSLADASEMVKWTNAWLNIRSERRDYERGDNDLPMENMFIHLAFNQLSNRQLRLWKKSLVEHVKPRRTEDSRAKLTITEEDIQLSELFDWFDRQLQAIKPDIIIPAFFEILQSIQSPFEVSLFPNVCDINHILACEKNSKLITNSVCISQNSLLLLSLCCLPF